MMPTLLTPVHHLTAARGGAAVASLLPPQAGDGHRKAHPRPPARRALQIELPAELERAVSHRLPAYSDPGVLGVEPAAVVRDLDVGEHAVESQLYPDVSGLGVAADVRERLPVQEAATNVRRPAEARHVRVELGLDGVLAYVEVSDDGCGFDPQNTGIGIGRQSMRHRALELGGEFDLQSAPGGGTRVRFSVPVSRLRGE